MDKIQEQEQAGAGGEDQPVEDEKQVAKSEEKSAEPENPKPKASEEDLPPASDSKITESNGGDGDELPALPIRRDNSIREASFHSRPRSRIHSGVVGSESSANAADLERSISMELEASRRHRSKRVSAGQTGGYSQGASSPVQRTSDEGDETAPLRFSQIVETPTSANGWAAWSRSAPSSCAPTGGVAAEKTPERIICNRWRMEQVIGKGSFGQIYLARDINSGEEVAVKLESKDAKVPQLLHEANMYRLLQGATGFPTMRGMHEDDKDRMLVLDKLGHSIEDLYELCARRLSLKTVLLLADQLLLRIEYMHSKGIIHRDIKPDNFLTGHGKEGKTVFAIDFGLSKMYMDPKTGKHIGQRAKRISDLVGTARYCSIRSHLGLQLSRRDDLESIGYVLVYLAAPGLPWQGLKANSNREKYERIGKVKINCPTSGLCQGLPPCFQKYIDYCKSLAFEEEPDYQVCRSLFRAAFNHFRFRDDGHYDWTNFMSRGLLTVGVIAGRNLTGKGSNGLSNAYSVVTVKDDGQKKKEMTRVVQMDLNPLWESLFEFPLSTDSATCEITVWSKSPRFFRDRFLGCVSIQVSELSERVLNDSWFPLQKRSSRSRVSGDIHLRVYYRKGFPQI
mmetsp:Transcript_19979/g.47565  ORF Transcript_19979/g.47565 Transcript_19979/m.47565 type:complete len:622 (+) Transcript_19979:242-2107(+)